MRLEHRFIICNHHKAEYAGILTVCVSPERETRREPMPAVRREIRADSAQVCPKAILLQSVPARISA
jgi:hypothetical protein